jgi:hypothetical protein
MWMVRAQRIDAWRRFETSQHHGHPDQGARQFAVPVPSEIWRGSSFISLKKHTALPASLLVDPAPDRRARILEGVKGL